MSPAATVIREGDYYVHNGKELWRVDAVLDDPIDGEPVVMMENALEENGAHAHMQLRTGDLTRFERLKRRRRP